jgi:hypothetical protein
MAKSLRQQLKEALNRVDKQVKVKIKEAAVEFSGALVEESIVDTGLMAANWLAAVDKERKDDLTHEDFGINTATLQRGGNIRAISEEAAKKIASQIEGYDSFKLGDEIIFSNSVPYLENVSVDRVILNALAGKPEGIKRANEKVDK